MPRYELKINEDYGYRLSKYTNNGENTDLYITISDADADFLVDIFKLWATNSGFADMSLREFMGTLYGK